MKSNSKPITTRKNEKIIFITLFDVAEKIKRKINYEGKFEENFRLSRLWRKIILKIQFAKAEI